MKESAIESALVRHAKKLGIYTAKFTSPSRRGVPDRIFIRDGVVLFLELKAPGEKPTELQMHEMRVLAIHDVMVMWTDNIEIGKKLLDALSCGTLAEDILRDAKTLKVLAVAT